MGCRLSPTSPTTAAWIGGPLVCCSLRCCAASLPLTERTRRSCSPTSPTPPYPTPEVSPRNPKTFAKGSVPFCPPLFYSIPLCVIPFVVTSIYGLVLGFVFYFGSLRSRARNPATAIFLYFVLVSNLHIKYYLLFNHIIVRFKNTLLYFLIYWIYYDGFYGYYA